MQFLPRFGAPLLTCICNTNLLSTFFANDMPLQPISLPLSRYWISRILIRKDPPQILHPIIIPYPIDMIYMWFPFWVGNKQFRHEPMC